MLTSDIHALQDLLLSICDKSDLDTLTQRDAQTVLHGIRDEAWRILADAAYVWNGAHAMFRLPHELLAECFSFLPFHCRFSASQVYRDWRTAAINTPALWADITGLDSGVRLTAGLVQCAFSRAGNVPLHFAYRHELNANLSRLVCSAMHRMASLSIDAWKRGYDILEQSAPLLESLRLWRDAYLTEEFLAGAPGKLAVLDATDLRLAPSCPGLSRLSTLRLVDCEAETLRDVFRLCPQLRSLSVRRVSWTISERVGNPPETLAELHHSSTKARYNVVGIYEEFRHCHHLKQIGLEQVVWDGDVMVGPVICGAVELDIVCTPKNDITLMAHFADGRCIIVTLHCMLGVSCSMFSPIFAHHTVFAQLRVLRIPLQALAALADCALRLTDADLRVDITHRLDRTATWVYSWERLGVLAVLVPRKAVLVVMPYSAGDGPDEHDVRELVAELAKVSSTVDIIVRGFSRDEVPENLIEAPNITFECDVAPV